MVEIRTPADLPVAVDVAIVGGGLAGLAAARVVSGAGLHLVVLEGADDVGGRVRTDVVDGFRLDRGFQVLLTAYPEARAQLRFDELHLGRFEPAARVWLGERFATVADPFRQPAALLRTLRAPVGTLADKLRLARLRRDVVRSSAAALTRRPDGDTASALIERGFSADIVERFFRPFFGGVQLDPDLATTSRMFELVFRSFSTGDAAVPAEGMAAIPRQLADTLPAGVVHTGVRVERLDGTTLQLADGTSMQARAVIVATDGPGACRLLGLDPVGSKAATAVWFAADQAPVAHRGLMLDGTGRGPAGSVAVLSNVVPSYAPPGRVLVVAQLAGRADAGAAEAVRAQLRGWFGSTVGGWDVLRTDVITHAQPTQPAGAPLKRRVELGSGRYVCGDHRDTASIQGALFSGRRTGERVVADLQRARVASRTATR
jgi:phytoene dehydrogenase-like protein